MRQKEAKKGVKGKELVSKEKEER